MKSEIETIREALKNIFPVLSKDSKKGDNGRIAVVGGSKQYTGAPYYAAISALKTGCDLSHIFCSQSSSIPIKTYSPQIIVHPLFKSSEELKLLQITSQQAVSEWINAIRKWYKAIDSWIIGPGLGRDPVIGLFFVNLIKDLPKDTIIIIDADGIYHLCENPDLLKVLKELRVIITPNFRQFTHLNKHLGLSLQQIMKQSQKGLIQKHSISRQICKFKIQKDLPASIFIKNFHDLILHRDFHFSYKIVEEGIPKRCGGIGDILAGSLAVACFWNFQYGPILASIIVKISSKKAYIIEGRGLTAPSIIKQQTKTIMQLQYQYDIIRPSI